MNCQTNESTSTNAKWNILQSLAICLCLMSIRSLWSFAYLMLLPHSSASLLPYYIYLFFLIAPAIFLQFEVGATYRAGIARICTKAKPLFKGIGIAYIIKLVLTIIYMQYPLGHTVYILYKVIQGDVRTWNSKDLNFGSLVNSTTARPRDTFYQLDILRTHKSEGLGHNGTFVWYLSLCSILVFVLIFFYTHRGPRFFGWIVLLSATFSFALFILFIAYAFSALKFSKEESATKSLNLLYEADWRRLGLKNRSNPSQTTLPKATFNVLYQPEPPVIKQPDALLVSQACIWLRPLIEVVLASQIGSGILPAVGKFGGNRLGRIVPIFFTLFVAVLPHLCTCAILPYIDLYLHVIWTHREKKHHKEVWYRHAPFSGPLFQEGLWAFMGSDIGITPAIRILFFVMLFFIQFHIVALYMLVLLDSLEEYLLPLWKRALTQSKCIFRMTLSFSLCALMYLLTLPLNFSGGFYWIAILDGYTEKLLCLLILFSIVPFTISYLKKRPKTYCGTLLCIWFCFSSVIVSGLLAFHALGDLLSNASSILKFSIIRAVANRKFDIYHFDKRAVVLGWLISATPILVGLLAGLFHTIVTSDGSFTVRLNYLFSGRKSQRIEARSNHDLLATGTVEAVQPTDELLVENKPDPIVRSWYESYEEAVSKSATLPLVRTVVPPHPSATLPRIKENYV